MSTQPPRRRRSPESPPPAGPSRGGGWVGLLAIGLGIVVAGLGIGALLGALHERGSSAPASITLATSAPVSTRAPERKRAPIAIATIVAPRTPRPSPTPTVMPSPRATPTEKPSARPSDTPKPMPTVKPTPEPTVKPTAVPTRKPVAVVAPTPTPRQTPTPTPTPTSTPVPAPPGIAGAAVGVVRQYIGALTRGDEPTGFALLGGAPGDRGLSLSEQSFLDPTARITSVRVTPIDATDAKVECEISAAKGTYFATYQVTSGPRGTYIAQHEFIKV